MTSCFQLPGSADVTFGIPWLPARGPVLPASVQTPRFRTSRGSALCLSSLFVLWLQVPRRILLPARSVTVPCDEKESLTNTFSWCTELPVLKIGTWENFQGFSLHVEKGTACSLAFDALPSVCQAALEPFLGHCSFL